MAHDTDSPPSPSSALTSASVIAKMAKIYGGMPLLSTLPDSPAARAGLRWGDVVVAVNGLPTPDAGAFVKARESRQGAALVRFVRDGKEREVELNWDPAAARSLMT
jgi:S1-C subfamily serine protease